MNNDKENTEYLQKCLGYCITGEICGRCLFIFWGKGANGKSTVSDLLGKILSKLSISASKSIFSKQINQLDQQHQN